MNTFSQTLTDKTVALVDSFNQIDRALDPGSEARPEVATFDLPDVRTSGPDLQQAPADARQYAAATGGSLVGLVILGAIVYYLLKRR